MLVDDILKLFAVVVGEGQYGALQFAGYSQWIQPGQQVPVKGIVLAQVRGEIPVVPAVVTTDGNL